MSLKETLERHPVWIALSLIAMGGTGGAALTYHLFVQPRDFEIARLERINSEQSERYDKKVSQLESDISRLRDELNKRALPDDSKIILEQIGVQEKTSVITKDGRLSMTIDSVLGSRISLTTRIDSQPAKQHLYKGIGDRILIEGTSGNYLVDLARARGNIVDLSVAWIRR